MQITKEIQILKQEKDLPNLFLINTLIKILGFIYTTCAEKS